MAIGPFVQQQVEPIVGEWVEFANSKLNPSHDFTRSELADHATVILLAIARAPRT